MEEQKLNQKRIRLIGNVVIGISLIRMFFVLLFAMIFPFLLLVTLFAADGGQEYLNGTLEGAPENEGFLIDRRWSIAIFMLMYTVLDFSIGLFLFKIGKSWRNGVLFGLNVIVAFKYIGVICIINWLFGFCNMFLVETVSHKYSELEIYNFLITNEIGVGNLSIGLILLALSYVLRYSHSLEEEVSLTV